VAQQRFVIGPQEGDRVDLGPGVGIVFKLEADQTGGAFSVVEHPVEPRALVWPHVHEQNDEFSYVLEGDIGVRIGEQEFTAGPGSYVLKPRGIHTPSGTRPTGPLACSRSSRQRALRPSSASWARCWQAQVSRTSPRWLRSRNATASEARRGGFPTWSSATGSTHRCSRGNAAAVALWPTDLEGLASRNFAKARRGDRA
jgi:hypothetical protein